MSRRDPYALIEHVKRLPHDNRGIKSELGSQFYPICTASGLTLCIGVFHPHAKCPCKELDSRYRLAYCSFFSSGDCSARFGHTETLDTSVVESICFILNICQPLKLVTKQELGALSAFGGCNCVSPWVGQVCEGLRNRMC